MKKTLVTSVLVFSIFFSFSSPNNASPNAQLTSQTSSDKNNSFWSHIPEDVRQITIGIVVLVIAGVITLGGNQARVILAKTNLNKKKELEKIREEIEKEVNLKAENKLEKIRQETAQETLDSLYKHEPLEKNEKRNSIVTVGIGGSGKTTLIHKMFSNEAQPEIATRFYHPYYHSETHYAHDVEIKYNYHVADYMGQNIGSLISGMLKEQKKPYSPMTWGAINSIIFLVDVAEASKYPGIQLSSSLANNSWQERVKRHIKEWSPTALDTIFGLVEIKSLQYVCLFINKFDLLQNVSEEEVKLKYEELIIEISIRCRGVYFEYLIGSVEKGTKLNDLKQSLQRYSYPKNHLR